MSNDQPTDLDIPEFEREDLLNAMEQAIDESAFEDVLILSELLLSREPDDADALVLRGEALSACGEFEEALAHYERAQTLVPDWKDGTLARIGLLLEMGRLDDANALTDALLDETPDRAEVHRARAIGWELAGNELGAERHYRRAQELDPTFPAPYRVSEATFRRLVSHSFASFPAEITPSLKTVDIRIQSVPDEEQKKTPTKPTSMLVLGYFDGPLQSLSPSEQSARDAPTHIYLFKKNFERICRNQAELSDQIARTLRHEWAHYMGVDVAELDEIDSN